MLNISFWQMLFTVINLIVLYLFMKKFLFKRIYDIIDKRQEEADMQLADAAASQKEADRLKTQYEGVMEGIDQEKKTLLTEAKKSADEEYHKIVTAASEEAQQIKKNASNDAEKHRDKILKQAEGERAKILKQAEKEIADMVVNAAVKVAGKGSSADIDSALYKEFLDKAGDE